MFCKEERGITPPNDSPSLKCGQQQCELANSLEANPIGSTIGFSLDGRACVNGPTNLIGTPGTRQTRVRACRSRKCHPRRRGRGCGRPHSSGSRSVGRVASVCICKEERGDLRRWRSCQLSWQPRDEVGQLEEEQPRVNDRPSVGIRVGQSTRIDSDEEPILPDRFSP